MENVVALQHNKIILCYDYPGRL